MAAVYDYEAQNEQEVSFSEGQVIHVLSDDDPDWIFAWFSSLQAVGYAPRNYFESDSSQVLPSALQVSDSRIESAADSRIEAELASQRDNPLINSAQLNSTHNGMADAPPSPAQDYIQNSRQFQQTQLTSDAYNHQPPATTLSEHYPASKQDSIGENAPNDIKYYLVEEYDKKKKKSGMEGFLGISDEFEILFVDESSMVI